MDNSKKYQIIDKLTTIRDKVDVIWKLKRRKYNTFKGKPTKFVLKRKALQEKYYQLDDLTEEFLMANIYRK